MVDPKVTGPPITSLTRTLQSAVQGARIGLAARTRRQVRYKADRQSQQQQAGNERVDDRRQRQPVDRCGNAPATRRACPAQSRACRAAAPATGLLRRAAGRPKLFGCRHRQRVRRVMVTVVQCISSGIDSDATSTMAQHVMCTCGFRTRRRFKPIHTTPPSKQGAQRRLRQNRQHHFFPPFALAFSRLLFRLGNLIGQHAQLTLVEHRRIHHADQDLFDGAVAEPVDDALDGFRRNPSARLGGLVDIGAPIHRVRGVALVFQSSQHGADGRFLERTGKPLAHGLGRDRTVGPNQLHDLAFEVAQFGQAVIHGATLRSRASMLQSVAYVAGIRNGYSGWNGRASPADAGPIPTPRAAAASACAAVRRRTSPANRWRRSGGDRAGRR